MSLTDTIAALISPPTRKDWSRYAKPGLIRSLSQYGATTAAFQAALDAGRGTLFVDVAEILHSGTSIAQAIQMRSDVAVLPVGDVWLKAGAANTALVVNVPEGTKNAVWGLSIDANGKGATSSAGLYLRPGCELIGAHFKGFTATSARGICCRDGVGTYKVHHCEFTDNYIGLCASPSTEYPGSGSVLDFYANEFSGNIKRGEYVILYADQVTVKRRCHKHLPPKAGSDSYTPALYTTSNRVNCRFAADSVSIGNAYFGNDLPYRNALEGTGQTNGIADMDIWHAVDGLAQKYILGVGGGEAFCSTAIRSKNVTKHRCLSIDQDTGFAIGARARSPNTWSDAYTETVAMTGCIAIRPALDRADEHAGSTAGHPGGGRHGFVGDTLDGLAMSGCHALGAARGKMKYGLSASLAANVDEGDLVALNAINGLVTVTAPA